MNKVPIEPMATYVAVAVEKPKEKTKSGLYLPESSKEKPTSGKVVATGLDISPSLIDTGDQIVFKKHNTTEVVVENQEYLLIEFDDIICKII